MRIFSHDFCAEIARYRMARAMSGRTMSRRMMMMMKATRGARSKAPGVGQHPPDGLIDWFQQSGQPVPDRGDKGLAQVQHVEIDQPGHDHMDQKDHECDVQKKCDD